MPEVPVDRQRHLRDQRVHQQGRLQPGQQERVRSSGLQVRSPDPIYQL